MYIPGVRMGAGGGSLLLLPCFERSCLVLLRPSWLAMVPPISWASSAVELGEDAQPFSLQLLGKGISGGGQ